MIDIEALRGNGVVLFGAGNEGVCAVDILKDNGINPLCFCDNYKEGIEPRTGLPIISTEKLVANYAYATVILTAIGYAEEIIKSLENVGVDENQIVTDFKAHLFKQPYLAYFELNIIDHCNLTCLGCSHFSPIAENRIWPLETVRSDLKRMSELTSLRVDEIHILGGEPLLHPDLDEILRTARRAFPNSVISIISNGLLLPEMDEAFWETCNRERITVEVTKYPINIDYDNIIQMTKEKGVAFKFHSYTGKAIKRLYKVPLDITGRQDPEASFLNCTLANRWIALMDGKMYTCQTAPNVHHFNRKFGTDMELEYGDCIDIHKVKNIDEILSFLAAPKPFCKYCKTAEVVNDIPWQPSKKEISEWT